jgi:hypothetical protein
MKASTFTCSLPPLLLEYKETFAFKNEDDSKEYLINRTIYHIDRQGYLLDSEGHYLITHFGTRIRLDEQHLKLLSEHSMLEL